MLVPASSHSETAARSSALRTGGLPNRCLAALARTIPDCVPFNQPVRVQKSVGGLAVVPGSPKVRLSIWSQ